MDFDKEQSAAVVKKHRDEIVALVESGDYVLADFKSSYKAKYGINTRMTDDQIIDFLCVAEADDPLDEDQRGPAMRNYEIQILDFQFVDV